MLLTDRSGIKTKTNVNCTNKPSTKTGHLQFRGFGLRGKAKVAGEFSLVCVAHNLKKIMLAALRGEVCPEFGKRAAWA